MLSSKMKVGVMIIILVVASSGIFLGIFLFQGFTTSPIRFGALTGDLHHMPLFVALEEDYFRDEGLDIDSGDISWFPNGNEVMVAFEAETLDVAYLGFAPAMSHKLTQNAPIKIISAVNIDGSAIMVKNGAGITSISDLEGKTIAVPSLNNIQDFILQIALNDVGLGTDDVKRIILSVGNMPNELEGDQIDAFVAWEPFCAKVTEGKGIYLKKSSEIWPNHPCCVIGASLNYLEEHSDEAEKIVRIHKRALQWMENPENHDELIEIAKKYTSITSDSTIEIALANVGYVYDFTEFSSEIDRFYDDLTTLNSNIPPYPSGRAVFFEEFLDSSYLTA